jgi:ABC-type uncharacterized transport system substrate-binding protein
MRRREFITLFGCAAIWPLTVRAQSAMPVIGFLNGGTSVGYAPFAAAFRRGLNEGGYIEGQNVVVEYRWAEGQYDRLPALAAELVRSQVTVIAATGVTAALAAKAASSTIPIVFTAGTDPVALGLVGSLSRPNGNLTGVSNYVSALGEKRVELIHQLVPTAAALGMLVNPTFPDSEQQANDVAKAASSFGLRFHVVNASTESEITGAFATLVQIRANALLVAADALLQSHRDQIISHAARHAMPVLYPWREAVVAGGLMSYGPNLGDGYRQAGIYVGRILKGVKPADLPVVQPTKFDFLVNLKTLKALNLTIPPTLLALADEVIE